jgi:uncharacterized protein DUF2630
LIVATPNKDTHVFSHIEALVAEEHKLFDGGELDAPQKKRLAEIQSELDRYWDLLRQRRALREFGDDPSKARERDADTVKKYLG